MTDTPESVKQARNFRETFGALTVEDWWAHGELLTERAKQLTHWSPEHDDAHSPAAWVVLLAQHVGDMADLALWSEGNRARFPDWTDTMKGHALHVGALAWAYVASLDRAILNAAEHERAGAAPQGDSEPSWKSFAEIDRDHSNSPAIEQPARPLPSVDDIWQKAQRAKVAQDILDAVAAAEAQINDTKERDDAIGPLLASLRDIVGNLQVVPNHVTLANDDTDRVEHPHKLDQSDWRMWAREHVTRGDLAVAEQIDPRAQFAALAALYEMIDATLASSIEAIHGGQHTYGRGMAGAVASSDPLAAERAEGQKAFARTLLALLRDSPQVYEALRAYQGPSFLLSRDERYS